MVGIDPGPFSFRTLWRMGAGAWAPYCEMLAQQANLNRDAKKHRPLQGVDVNPFAHPDDKRPEQTTGAPVSLKLVTGMLKKNGWKQRKMSPAERASLFAKRKPTEG